MSQPSRPRQPWWIPPFLGRVPAGVEPRHLSLLGVIALALFFEEYDLAMLTAALPRIAATFGVSDAALPFYLSVIRLGAIPAFALIPLADRWGRRRVFLVALACTGLFTFLTGFSQTIEQFVVCQMLTRTFFITGSAVAFVMVAEEFPAAHRGWGIGMLGALGVSGHGFASLIYSQVDSLPFDWRALYLIGVAPVLLLPLFRRRVLETGRYHQHAAERIAALDGAVEGFGASFRPLAELARAHPARAVGIAIAGFLPSIGLISAFQFSGQYTQKLLGWSPGEYATMVILGGGVGIIGNVAAGFLGDRFGRRAIGLLLLGSFPIWVGLFYHSSGLVVALAYVAIVFASSGGRIILRALATELFPTSRRASASGLFAILEAVGSSVGLFVLGSALAGRDELLGFYVSLLALSVAAGALVLLFFPETKQRELEAINEDEEGAFSAATVVAGADSDRSGSPG